MSELTSLASMAGQFGPFIAVIGLLFRSNAMKDRIIERMSLQLLEATVAQKEVARVTQRTVEAVQDSIGSK